MGLVHSFDTTGGQEIGQFTWEDEATSEFILLQAYWKQLADRCFEHFNSPFLQRVSKIHSIPAVQSVQKNQWYCGSNLELGIGDGVFPT